MSQAGFWALPLSIRFCFSIKSVKCDHDVQPPLKTGTPDSLSMPPTDRRAIQVTEDTDWYYWFDGIVRKVPPHLKQHIKEHGITSIFWCSDRQAFMHVEYDCAEESVAEKCGGISEDIPLPWRRLSFHYLQAQQGRCISLVGYQLEQDNLGAPGSSTWMPELLPEVYQFHGTPEYQAPCQLGGRLSTLLGLIAFSTSPQTMISTIGNFQKSGLGTVWVPHGRQGQGSKYDRFGVTCGPATNSHLEGTHERGLIVRIGFDPRAGLGMNSEFLRAWEDGRYGPIIP